MIVEQLIFITLACTLFVYMFYKLIKTNDTKYVTILAIEALRNCNRFYTIVLCQKWNWNFYKIYYIYAVNTNSNIYYCDRKNR